MQGGQQQPSFGFSLLFDFVVGFSCSRGWIFWCFDIVLGFVRGYEFYWGTTSKGVGGHESPPKWCPSKGPLKVTPIFSVGPE